MFGQENWDFRAYASGNLTGRPSEGPQESEDVVIKCRGVRAYAAPSPVSKGE